MRAVALLCCALALVGCRQAPGVAAPTVAPPAPTPSARAPTATPRPAAPSATPRPEPSATPRPAAPTATAAPEPSATPAPARPTETRAVRYVFPLKAKRYQISPSHHDYPASDITCPIGSEFLAVTDGVVDFVSAEDVYRPATDRPEDRGGLSVAIVGEDGVRYYGSHLSAVAEGIAPGVRVAAGQRLGLTGDSGNARGTDPHLHFGISRPSTPDDWQARRGQIWPQRYLRAWARGEQVTPVLEP